MHKDGQIIIWKKTGEILKFNQVNSANVSTIDLFSDVADGHQKARKKVRYMR